VAFLAEQGTEGWSALHLERNLGAGAAAGALGPAFLGLAMAMGRFSGQAVARRYSEAVLLRLAASLAACGALVAAWATALGMAYLGFALLGLGVSVCAPLAFAWVGRLVAPECKARAVSRIAVLGYAGFFVGPPMMGLLSEASGLAASFSAVALLLLTIPAALVPLLSRRETAAGRAAA
jgi:MFS family permease